MLQQKQQKVINRRQYFTVCRYVENLLLLEYVCIQFRDGLSINYLCYEYRIRQKFHLVSRPYRGRFSIKL